jgi:hypothetical protein
MSALPLIKEVPNHRLAISYENATSLARSEKSLLGQCIPFTGLTSSSARLLRSQRVFLHPDTSFELAYGTSMVRNWYRECKIPVDS